MEGFLTLPPPLKVSLPRRAENRDAKLMEVIVELRQTKGSENSSKTVVLTLTKTGHRSGGLRLLLTLDASYFTSPSFLFVHVCVAQPLKLRHSQTPTKSKANPS